MTNDKQIELELKLHLMGLLNYEGPVFLKVPIPEEEQE
jgi:hypothetical protein